MQNRIKAFLHDNSVPTNQLSPRPWCHNCSASHSCSPNKTHGHRNPSLSLMLHEQTMTCADSSSSGTCRTQAVLSTSTVTRKSRLPLPFAGTKRKPRTSHSSFTLIPSQSTLNIIQHEHVEVCIRLCHSEAQNP